MLPGRPSRTTGQHVDHDRPRRGPPTSCSCCAALLSRDSFLQILSASSSMSAFAAAAAQTSMAADGLLLLRYSSKASATHGSSITKVEGCQLSRSVSINFVMVSSAAMLHAVRGQVNRRLRKRWSGRQASRRAVHCQPARRSTRWTPARKRSPSLYVMLCYVMFCGRTIKNVDRCTQRADQNVQPADHDSRRATLGANSLQNRNACWPEPKR